MKAPTNKARTRLLLAALVLLLLPAARAADAATLAHYRERVQRAATMVGGLAGLGEGDARADEGRTLSDVRALLPKTETVERGGGSMLVNNVWLHDALDGYEKTRGGLKRAQRAEALGRVAERLRALEARLAEAEGGAAAPARDKDAEKGRLAAILRGPDFNQKPSEGGALRGLLEQFLDWLTSLFPRLRPLRPAPNARLSLAAQVVIFALALTVVGFLVWKYWWKRRAGLTSIGARERRARVVLGERIAADETAADLLAEAERLARGGDLRGAIRKAYVALLCELGDRKVIGLARHKTNRDYLLAVRAAAPPLHPAMLILTDSFERHWYGREAASDLDWHDFRARCRQALSVK